MGSRRAIVRILHGLLEELDEDGDGDGEGVARDVGPDDEGGFAPGMTRAEKEKARRTLLTEYPRGTVRMLPEHKPVGPLPEISLLGPRGRRRRRAR